MAELVEKLKKIVDLCKADAPFAKFAPAHDFGHQL